MVNQGSAGLVRLELLLDFTNPSCPSGKAYTSAIKIVPSTPVSPCTRKWVTTSSSFSLKSVKVLIILFWTKDQVPEEAALKSAEFSLGVKCPLKPSRQGWAMDGPRSLIPSLQTRWQSSSDGLLVQTNYKSTFHRNSLLTQSSTHFTLNFSGLRKEIKKCRSKSRLSYLNMRKLRDETLPVCC